MGNTVNEIKKTTGKHIKYGIQKTRELKFYLLKFVFRVAIFISVLWMYLTELMMQCMKTKEKLRG